MKLTTFFLALCTSSVAFSHTYWQQEVHYEMDIDLDVKEHRFTGYQKLTYFNNSPDTLNEVFYHLYFNAFQPGSMMDERSRDLPDPDKRVGDRISKLKEDETGYHRILSLTHNGESTFYEVWGTVLKVTLKNPVLPGDSAVFEMNFESQVPVQIRRSGRDNAEGVDYTMTQWYPKIAEYDEHGWHPDPYVAREFYGVFGTFDVNISIDKDYRIGGTGVLLNEEAKWEVTGVTDGVSHYELLPEKTSKRQWRFHAENVHDFAWAADPDFIRASCAGPGSLVLNFFYLEGEWKENWEKLPEYTARFFSLMNEHFGAYAYPQFSVIQGGDGGMEYPMCTMLKGTGTIEGLVGVMVHESAHNWYYGMLASNETQYPWMDEGFTSFAEEEILNIMMDKGAENPHKGAYRAYYYLVSTGGLEPMSTPGDYFAKNMTYGISSYSRGAIFLAQLRYITGEEAFKRGMLAYYRKWRFKHPDPWDFLKVMEEESGLQLDWYRNFWVYTTKVIDYGIKEVSKANRNGQTRILLEKPGEMPMPLHITVTGKDGSEAMYEIPLVSMFGYGENDYRKAEPWPWTSRDYELLIDFPFDEVKNVVIDKEGFMADVNKENNTFSPVD